MIDIYIYNPNILYTKNPYDGKNKVTYNERNIMLQDLFNAYFQHPDSRGQSLSCEAEAGGIIDQMFKPPNGNSVLVPFSFCNRKYIFAVRKSDDEKFEDILSNDPKDMDEYLTNFHEKKWEEKFYKIPFDKNKIQK